MGQGNSASGTKCRDASGLILKCLEEKQLGVMLQHPVWKEIIQRIAIVFANNANFYANRLNHMLKMQIIIDACAKLHEATWEKIQ